MTGFAGKVAVVTGAGSGIGRALALELGARGARLAISDIDSERIATASALLLSSGIDVLAARVDVGNRDAMQAHAAAVVAHFGVVHQLYSNAGIATRATFVDATPPEEYERILRVNLWGVIHGTQAFLPHLIASGDGHVTSIRRAEIYDAKLFTTSAEDAARIIVDGVARKRGRVLIGQARGVDRLVRALPSAHPRLVAAWSRRVFGEA